MTLKEDKLRFDLNENLIEETLYKLDNWLISLNEYSTLRMNPRKFAIDKDVNFHIAKSVFLAGVSHSLFNIIFEIRSDDNEYLDSISYEKYRKLIEEGSLEMYSVENDCEILVFDHNVQVWFELIIKPVHTPSFFEKSQESEVRALPSSAFTIGELDTWLS